MDSDIRQLVFCHVCEKPTDHVNLGDRTVAAGGAVDIVWLTCCECGAEDPR